MQGILKSCGKLLKFAAKIRFILPTKRGWIFVNAFNGREFWELNSSCTIFSLEKCLTSAFRFDFFAATLIVWNYILH